MAPVLVRGAGGQSLLLSSGPALLLRLRGAEWTRMAFFSSDITKSCTYTRLRDVGRDHFQVIHVVHTAPLELAVHPKATTYRIPPYSVDMSHMLLNLKPTKLSH